MFKAQLIGKMAKVIIQTAVSHRYLEYDNVKILDIDTNYILLKDGNHTFFHSGNISIDVSIIPN